MRYTSVTGVQTCALPISIKRRTPFSAIKTLQSVCSVFIALNGVRALIGVGAFAAASGALKLADRSEERRVGRGRGSRKQLQGASQQELPQGIPTISGGKA